MLKARASLFLRARACPEHVLALWGYSHSRGTRLSAHTLDTTESSLSAKPGNAPPLTTVCVHAMFSQEPVEPNRRMPYAASYTWAKPASLWSANHTTLPHPHTSSSPLLTSSMLTHTHTDTALTRTHHLTEIPFSLALRRRVALLLACTTVTSALPDMEVHKGSARELLWASNDPTPTPTPQPRSGSVVWMGNPDEFEAVTAGGLLSPSPSPSDSEDEWNRRDLKGKNRRALGKKGSSCGSGGKKAGGKKASSESDPWECRNGKLIGNGFDYDEDVAQTKDGRPCKKWNDVVDKHNNKYAFSYYGLGNKDKNKPWQDKDKK